MTKRLEPLRPALSPENQTEWLRVFFHRARGYADAVRSNQIGFLDAVSIVADAARDSGLADVIEDRRLQKVIAFAFMGVFSPQTPPAPMPPDLGEPS
jgi:hypothetical protein